MTGSAKPLQDPAIFEKNDGAIAPVLAVALDWPPADFFFRPFFRGARPKIPAAHFFWGSAANMPVYTTSYNVPPPGGALGPHRAHKRPPP